jgi:hypothetical protein
MSSPGNPPNPYSEEERRTILDDFAASLKAMYAAFKAAETETATERIAELKAEGTRNRDRVSELWDGYVARTPRPVLSRCPFSGVEVRHSLDTFGLDGLWWNNDTTARPTESLPKTFFALAGAVKLADEIENAEFLVKPGPEVPYVTPRLLEKPEIQAVVSSIKVGKHTAYPVFYFADPTPWNVLRVNTWGKNLFEFIDASGELRWAQAYIEREDYDFDLAKWLDAGKLFWIAPDDPNMRLHGDSRRCPYLDLPGNRYPQNVERGKVWPAVNWE